MKWKKYVDARIQSCFRLLVFSTVPLLAVCLTAHADDASNNSLAAKKSAATLGQPWQERRAQFAKIVNGVRAGDAASLKSFDDVLTEFDTKNLHRTPMENMEILGVYYVPREGVEKTLSIVVLNAMLGWYDTLRFASPSGRSEISHSLFKMPFVVAGPEASAKAAKFFDEQPEKTEKIVAMGISFARNSRGKLHYDEHWPTAYGLERSICAQKGPCEEIPALAESQWDAAWLEAEQLVRTYYRGDEPAKSAK